MDEYIHNMRNIISAQKAKNKIKSEWYKRVPFKKTLCWVNDINKNPAEGGVMVVVKNYRRGSLYPFRFGGSTSVGYKYATPLTKEEVLRFIVEEQEKMSSKEFEWYERIPFKKTLCWISNYIEKPMDKVMIVVKGYHKGSSCPFRFGGGKKMGYKYAVPLTKEEVLKFIVEVQENE